MWEIPPLGCRHSQAAGSLATGWTLTVHLDFLQGHQVSHRLNTANAGYRRSQIRHRYRSVLPLVITRENQQGMVSSAWGKKCLLGKVPVQESAYKTHSKDKKMHPWRSQCCAYSVRVTKATLTSRRARNQPRFRWKTTLTLYLLQWIVKKTKSKCSGVGVSEEADIKGGADAIYL